jgi:heat shock protein HtpX
LYEQIARNKRRTVACVAAFFVVWVGIGALVGLVWAAASKSPGTASPTNSDVATGIAVAAALALIGIAFSLRSGTRMVLAASGARPADPAQYLQLHNIVEALAIGEGIPKPAVYVIDDPSPNAFATGTSPQHAAVTATTGLLTMMNREELEGVIAHELSHIKNYDVRLLLIVSTLIGMAALLASIMWRSAFFMRRGSRQSGQLMLIVFAAGALLAVVAVIFGPIVRFALSRQRESLADVSSVELTRNPEGLIRALQKLQTNDQPFAKFNHATAAMCIDDPLQHHESWFHHLFDTHPPIAERIAVLKQIEYGKAA